MDQFWAGVLLASIPSISITLITALLGRKNANRHLNVEEGSLSVDVFAEQRQAYNALLTESRTATQAALDELKIYRDERTTFSEQLEAANQARMDTDRKLERLRVLFAKVVQRSNIELTPEEEIEFGDTKPASTRRGAKLKS